MLLNRHRAKKPDIEEIQAVEPVEEVPAIDYEAMTKAEIIGVLEKAVIEHDARQKKETLISLLKNKPEGELGGLWFVGKHSKIERTAEQEQQLLALIDEFANDIESEEAFWKGVLSKEFLNPLRASEDNLEAMSDEEMEKLLGDEDSVIVFNAPQVSQEPEQVDFDLTNRSKLKEALQVFSIEDRKLIRERKIALSEKYFRNYRNGQIEDIFDIFQINGIKVKISSNSNIGENGIWPSELVS